MSMSKERLDMFRAITAKLEKARNEGTIETVEPKRVMENDDYVDMMAICEEIIEEEYVEVLTDREYQEIDFESLNFSGTNY